MTEVWTQWEGQAVNGIYPLRRFLNASDHSAVFLTESSTEGFLNAAIKLVPGDPELTAVQLWHWKTAATLSHPHLIRLLDSGQCEIGGRPFLFVVMEYAEETLSQTLPYRALGTDEVRELLVPTLEALAFLHRENWVHGQVKPSNFLVVDDQLKLAADTIRPIAVSAGSTSRPSIYDAPETERGEVSAAADIWGLGVTLVEALTQYSPTWPNGKSEPASLPTNVPPEFLDTVQRCLSVDPADRPTVEMLQAATKPAAGPVSRSPPLQTGGAGATSVAGTIGAAGAMGTTDSVRQPAKAVPPAEPVMRATAASFSVPEDEVGKRSLVVPAVAAVIVVFLGVWGGNRMFHRRVPATPPAAAPESQVAVPAPVESPVPPAVPSGAPSNARPPQQTSPPPVQQPQLAQREATPPASPPRGDSNSVVHEEIPRASPSARATIIGHIKVTVRVTVDSSGKVVRDSFENPGPSRYFSRLASEAAKKWRFAAADTESSREWLLRFEFGRDGTTVHATRSRS